MQNRPSAAVTPDVLLGLDEEYASILALLDRAAARQRIVTRVPQLTGRRRPDMRAACWRRAAAVGSRRGMGG